MPPVPPPDFLPHGSLDSSSASLLPPERTTNRLRRAPDRQKEKERERPKRPQVETHAMLDDFLGSVLVVVAILFFLALFSYDPHDLPTWAPFNPTDTQNAKPVNYVGTMGALGAFYSVMLAGMATYLVAFSLMWFGVCKLVSHIKITARHWLGVVFMVLAGAAIIDLMAWDFGQGQITPLGNGGAIGCMVGGKVALNVLGPVGSLLVLSLFYFTGLVFVTGMHPVQVLASARKEIPQWWQWLLARLARPPVALEEMPPVSVIEAGKRKGRGKTGTVSSVGSSTATEPPVELFVAQELPLSFDSNLNATPPVEPEINIIDSSVPKPVQHDDTRPPLADVWAKKRKQKIEQTGPAPSGSLTERFKDYTLPSLDFLNWPDPELAQPADPGELRDIQDTIVRCLSSFQISVTKGDITRGPAITRYEVRPVDGLRVSRISQLEPDIARATKAERINILAPIPGKDTVGIEIANKHKVLVPLRELLEDDTFQNGKSKLPIALGKDVYGKTIIADLAAMPHLLVAGATGSGKSVCINSIITSLICRFAPDELRFIMIDPKVVEMQTYAELPHLALPVVTDPKKALLALRWVVREMETRYQIFAKEGCRNFETFNNRNRKKASASRAKNSGQVASAISETIAPLASEPEELVYQAGIDPVGTEGGDTERHHISLDDSSNQSDELNTSSDGGDAMLDGEGIDWSGDAPPPANTAPYRADALIIPDTMPYVVVIIDELADLMQTAPADIEVAIARITQMARAAGIHLIVATQTPRADVITGVIKANVPSRIAFQVASAIDSRVILDRKGAEKLVGKGDMLYLPPGTANLVRSQGAFVTDDEIHALVAHCVSQGKPVFDNGGETLAGPAKTNFGDEEDGEDPADSEDERILEKCLEVIRQEKKASTSLLQRRLGLGYTRAARMMDVLEERGIIGPGEGAKPREILVRLD